MQKTFAAMIFFKLKKKVKINVDITFCLIFNIIRQKQSKTGSKAALYSTGACAEIIIFNIEIKWGLHLFMCLSTFLKKI